MSKIPAHPDTIRGLAPDCRRVLRNDYSVIQARQQALRYVDRDADLRAQEAEAAARRDGLALRCDVRAIAATLRSERVAALQAAIAEYHRTAAAWGVES